LMAEGVHPDTGEKMATQQVTGNALTLMYNYHPFINSVAPDQIRFLVH
jgi:hypothetical protein